MSSSSSKSDSEMQTPPQKEDNQNTNKPIDGKISNAAAACFYYLGQDPKSVCAHGLLFYQCMPCSH